MLISARARIDIRRNAEWWGINHSRAKAEEWFYRVYDQLKAIGNAPLGYGLSVENDLFPFEVREALVGLGKRKSYRAIFSLQDVSITVYRVLRAAEGAISPDDLE
ncbi:MAG TPA: hypothetical protein PLY87_19130 [Planctomycetaceae bacterium]|nr:hypothetical protein [Planctomycetaceae bacterium]